MSLLTYKLTIEIPISSPNGDPPEHEEITATNEVTGEAIELRRADAIALRNFLQSAWMQGRPLG